LVDSCTAPVQHSAAARAGLYGRLQHAAAPTLANDGDDERSIDIHEATSREASFIFKRTTRPNAITETIGASAMSAASPSPCTSGSRPAIAAATPKASASRNVFASGPVATPPESIAIATKERSLSHISAIASA